MKNRKLEWLAAKLDYFLLKVLFSIIRKQCKYCVCCSWKMPENVAALLCGRKEAKKRDGAGK